MNYMKKMIVLFMFCCMTMIGSTIYAADTQGANVTVQSEEEGGKIVEYLASEDGYISRITQPNKINMTTFESKINLMGEALYQGTDITIEIYDTKVFTKAGKTETYFKSLPTNVYNLGKVGATKTFNQLLDLAEGENKIVVRYTLNNVKDEMEFYITRESEENKQQIKNYIVFPSVKITQ